MDNQKNEFNGPVFEIAPGWGFKVKKWLKRNGRVIIPALIGIILASGAITVYRNSNSPAKPFVARTQNNKVLAELVGRGDGRVLIARRALTSYIQNTNIDLTPAQRIFIEQVLSEKIGKVLSVGETVEFNISDIESAIDQSLSLTPVQLQKWGAYAKTVKF